LDGKGLKLLGPHVFEISKKKKWSVKQALSLNTLIDQIDFAQLQSADNITEFVNLWAMLEHSQMHEGVVVAITWKFTTSGNIPS
jgi:hypothetical protein